MRIDRIRIVAVVEHLVVLRTAGYDQMIETATRERRVGTRALDGNMVGVKAGEFCGHDDSLGMDSG